MTEQDAAGLIGYRCGVEWMTLRDWFAGQTLQGLLAGNSVYHFDTASSEAYLAADAMLEARKK